jgi:cytochrome c oxidase subunit I
MPLGLLAWMQNMMSASIPIGFLYAAMLMSLLLVIPIGAIFVNLIGTLAGGVLRMRAPLIFSLAALSTLSFGLILELIQSVIPVNWLLGDTTASTAASGYVLVGGAVLGGFAALYYWFPKITGRVMGESLARSSATLIVLGAQVTFIPLFLAGVEGQQVDIFKFFEASDAINSMSLNAYNLIATIGAFVLSLGVVLTIVNAYVSLRSGVRTGPDAWGGETLEWFATSPPPPHNFDVVPDVRSDEPLRDIREAVRGRDASPATPAETHEPVA